MKKNLIVRSQTSILASAVGCILASAALAGPPQLLIVGKPEAASQMSFEVALPLRNVDELKTLLTALHDPASPQYHQWLTPKQFGTRFGPDAATKDAVAKALSARGFSVETHTRSLHVSGPVELVESALGTHLQLAHTDNNASNTRVVSDSELTLPSELKEAGATVVSFAPMEAHVMSKRTTSALSADKYGKK